MQTLKLPLRPNVTHVYVQSVVPTSALCHIATFVSKHLFFCFQWEQHGRPERQQRGRLLCSRSGGQMAYSCWKAGVCVFSLGKNKTFISEWDINLSGRPLTSEPTCVWPADKHPDARQRLLLKHWLVVKAGQGLCRFKLSLRMSRK